MERMEHLEYFQTLARYNRWMNEKLYAICAAEMTDQERRQERGAPFKSLHGTLNHLLLGDRLWLGRFKNQPFIAPSLSHELYVDFEELKREREISDQVISSWVNALTEEALAGDLTYTSLVNPAERTLPLWFCALHFFNHQAHHRGQVTTLIEQAGYDCGVTDLLMLPQES